MERLPQLHHLSQGNPQAHGQGDVPALLRTVAATIAELGTVTIQDMAFLNEITGDGLWPSLTAYFHYGELGEPCTCGRCDEGTPNPAPESSESLIRP